MIALLLAAAIPAIRFVDDTSRVRTTEEWRGAATIVVPMYTRCPVACPMTAENLTRAALRQNMTNYRVVFFSFDPRDTAADLHAFRERHRIPLAWTMASAAPADTRRLMDAIGFHFSESMMHPNFLAVLAPDLARVQTFSASSMGAALEAARGGSDWAGRFGGYALAALLLIATLSAIYLAQAVLFADAYRMKSRANRSTASQSVNS
jgi:cytochrome oxidase Cu insertion factor (SCO1/SenC/PrrC family)